MRSAQKNPNEIPYLPLEIVLYILSFLADKNFLFETNTLLNLISSHS